MLSLIYLSQIPVTRYWHTVEYQKTRKNVGEGISEEQSLWIDAWHSLHVIAHCSKLDSDDWFPAYYLFYAWKSRFSCCFWTFACIILGNAIHQRLATRFIWNSRWDALNCGKRQVGSNLLTANYDLIACATIKCHYSKINIQQLTGSSQCIDKA